jgi:hypothetical protein
MGAEHTIKQSQIDAARIKQAADNAAKLSLAESQRIIQRSNNAASDIYADSARRVQTANNDAATSVAAGRTTLRDTGNAINKSLAADQRAMQASYNEQGILVHAAKKVVQEARNARAAVDSDVARWSQSLKNKRILDEGGERSGQVLNETLHGMDRAVNQGVFARIEASRFLGATTATAAALGVGGSSIDQIKDTIQMQQALQEQASDDDLHAKVIAGYRQRGNVMADAIGALDFSAITANMDRDVIDTAHDSSAISDNQDYSPIFAQLDYQAITAQKDFTVFTADLDYTKYMDHKKMGFLQTWFTINAAAVATYFGGPQAGEAVVDASIGINDAQNLDFASANKQFGSALSNGMAGMQTYRAGASGSSSGTPWADQFRSKPATATAQPYVSNLGSVQLNLGNYGGGYGNSSQGYGSSGANYKFGG